MAGKKATGKKANKAQEKPASASLQRRRSPEDAPHREGDGIIDATTRRDIVGVVFIVLAVVMMLLAVMPSSDAVLSGIASKYIHLTFGIGCYILPFVLLAIGLTFLYKFRTERVPARAAIGLTVIFVALLGFIALFAPISNVGKDDPSLLFSEYALVGYGGYIGSALAWCGIMLLGRVISGVIFVGFMIIGLLIVGFSISRLIEVARAKKEGFERLHSPERHSSSAGFARVRRAPQDQMAFDDVQAYMDAEVARPGFDPNHTAVFGVPQQADSPAVQPAFQRSRRIVPQEDYEPEPTATRRLVPIVRQDLGNAPFDDEPPFDEDMPLEPMSLTRPLSRKKAAASNNPRDSRDFDDDAEVVEPPVDVEPEAEGDTNNPRRKQGTPRKRAPKAASDPAPTPLDGFVLPSMKLLNVSRGSKKKGSATELEHTADALQTVLSDFNIDAEVVDWIAGPTVTLFEVDLPAGVRVSRVTALTDDIALALASPGVRIFAPVPGTNYVGIEVPNAKRETVLLSDVLKDAPEGPLQIAIGKDVEGHSIVSDLAKMPHLLIGGTTGSGKSVAINGMIMSILMRATPAEVRFIMIDPKRVEFTPYNGIPHLYVPVVTEPKEAASALAWGVAEMERRLKVFSTLGARNIGQYNAKVKDAAAKGEPFLDASGEKELEELPYIVIIIDELADLMMNVGKEVEISISRIAQLARAAGIHLIVATQRPSANVVTGLIKANITNRIAFNVASSVDSRVVLDSPGAESLIGLGDLLLSKPELAKPQRIQGCFVTEDEINAVVDFIKGQATPEYHSEILNTNTYSHGDTSPSGGSGSDRDPLLWEAADIVVSSNMGSTSNIQRRLKVGYARAGRIMDQLEEIGVVGPANGSRPRDVLLDEMELETVKAFETSE